VSEFKETVVVPPVAVQIVPPVAVIVPPVDVQITSIASEPIYDEPKDVETFKSKKIP
jgi:hypothetical protein